MAFFVNNKSVGFPIFVKSDEILIPNSMDSDYVPDKIKCEAGVEKLSAEKTKPNPKNEDSKVKQNNITSATVSNCGKYICACDSINSLHLWKHEKEKWEILSVRSLTRKCQKVIFTNSSSSIILCDRGGDVFEYSVSKYEESGNLILGHISLILDIAISSDDEYLATCDRDGKIRISCYPNSYNILGYCLGHQEFVSTIQFITLAEEILLSSSGDGSIRLWKYKNGMQLKSISLHENTLLCNACSVKKDVEVADKLNHEVSEKLVLSEKQVLFSIRCVKYCKAHQLLAIVFHLQPVIAIYKLADDRDDSLTLKELISLDSPPVDAVFRNDGQLLILIKKFSLKCFDYRLEDQKFVAIGVDDSLSVFKGIQDFYNDFENIYFQDDFVSLFKRVYETNNDEEDCSFVQKKNKTE